MDEGGDDPEEAYSRGHDDLEAVIEAVRQRVEPTESERKTVEETIDIVIERTREAIESLPVDAEVVHVGSTARDTWLVDDRDIDIFVRFSPEIDRDALESYGLEVGHAVLPDGQEEYAEHPYVSGPVEGFDVDVVPCYDVDDATDIRTSVDRTPFHTTYIAERITPELASETRVCKQLFSAIGIYGSNLRTKGFSGFLTELLVLEYGGIVELLEAAADWQPPVEFDPEDHGAASFSDPLVVIDPTDPERNVAAVLSEANVARFQHYARALLADPRESVFDSSTPTPTVMDEQSVEEAFESRGTTPVAIAFEAPAIVDDQLWPQLERSLGGIRSGLEGRGFDVFRADIFVDEQSRQTVLLFELAVASRPRLLRHEGPPVHVREHAASFYEQYAAEDSNDSYGPFIDGNRYVVERPRTFTDAISYLESDAVEEVALGARIEPILAEESEVLAGEELFGLADQFGAQFGAYLNPTPRTRLYSTR